MADDMRLNIRSSLDASGVRSGAQESADAVEAAASKISAANVGVASSADRAASAPGELAQKFMAQGISAKDAEGALVNLGYSAREAAATMESLAAATAQTTASTEEASAAIQGLNARVMLGSNGIRVFAREGISNIYLIGAAIAATFAASAIKGIADTEQQLANLSAITGETVSNLAAMQAAAAPFGVTTEDLASSLRKLSETI